MMKTVPLFRLLTLAVMGGLTTGSIAQTESAGAYPERPIRVIVPFAAGGGGDTSARIVSEQVSKILDVQMVIDNRPGSSGLIGSTSFINSAPDGYTIIYNTNTITATGDYLFKNIAFDPVTAFKPIALVGSAPMFLAVANDSAVTNLNEFVEWLKKASQVRYSYHNSTTQVAGSVVAKQASGSVTPIAYKSPITAMTELSSGLLDFSFVEWGVAKPFMDSDRLRLIAVSSAERAPFASELPSLKEADLSDFGLQSWGGYLAPAGTPDYIVEKLSKAIRQALEMPNVVQHHLAGGVTTTYLGPEAFQEFIRTQRVEWGQRIKEAGIEPQ